MARPTCSHDKALMTMIRFERHAGIGEYCELV